MGQYYLLVNHTKKEYVCPWCLGGLGKLKEWMSPQSYVLPYLLRKSTGEGGGDISPEGKEYLGRWAGDSIMFLGDYDKDFSFSNIQDEYKNITIQLVKEMGKFAPYKDYGACGSHSEESA